MFKGEENAVVNLNICNVMCIFEIFKQRRLMYCIFTASK